MSFPSDRLASAVAYRGQKRRYRDTSTRMNLRRIADELVDDRNSASSALGARIQIVDRDRAQQIAEILRAVANEYVEEKAR